MKTELEERFRRKMKAIQAAIISHFFRGGREGAKMARISRREGREGKNGREGIALRTQQSKAERRRRRLSGSPTLPTSELRPTD